MICLSLRNQVPNQVFKVQTQIKMDKMIEDKNSIQMSDFLVSSREESDPFETVTKNRGNEGVSKKSLGRIGIVSLFLVTQIISLTWIFVLQSQVNSLIEVIEDFRKIKNENFEMVELRSILNSSNFIPRTCHEYDIEKSGYYTIDPKKQNGASSKMRVFCDHTKKASQVNHNHLQTTSVQRCDTQNCFQINLTYETSMENIESLIDASEECYQEIEFLCYLSKITGFASFQDRNGVVHNYFYDNKTTNCLCYEENSCFSLLEDHKNRCNCDLGDTFQRIDVIPIRNKDVLPITSFNYGLMHQQEQSAKVKIGPLICKGVKPLQSSIVGDSCENLRLLGQPPGYYILPSKFNFDVTFCDMIEKEMTEIKLILTEDKTLNDQEPIRLKFNKIIMNGKEEEHLDKIPENGVYTFNTSFHSPQISRGGGYIKIINFGEHVSHDLKLWLNSENIGFRKIRRYMKKSESLIFSLSCVCFTYNSNHTELPKSHPDRIGTCSLKCSEQKPCIITLTRSNMKLANIGYNV